MGFAKYSRRIPSQQVKIGEAKANSSPSIESKNYRHFALKFSLRCSVENSNYSGSFLREVLYTSLLFQPDRHSIHKLLSMLKYISKDAFTFYKQITKTILLYVVIKV